MPIDITAEKLIKQVKKDLAELLDMLQDEYIPTRVIQEAFYEHRCPELDLFLATFTDTPSAIIEELCDKELREDAAIALASHGRLPVSSMVKIAKESTSIPQKIALAANQAISPQAAAALSTDPDKIIRAALAANKEVPPRLREVLHLDTEPEVRLSALQRFADEEAWKRSCFDLDIQVKIKAVLNGRYDDEFLAVLAHSNDSIIQSTLLERKNLSSQILRPMLFSPDFEVAVAALECMKLDAADQAGILNFNPGLIEALLRSQLLDPLVIREFIRSAETEQLILLLETQELELKYLQFIAENAKPELAKKLIEVSESHPDIIRQLSRASKETIYTIALYADLSSAQIANLFSDQDRLLIYILSKRGYKCPNLPGILAAELAEDPIPSIANFAKSSAELTQKSETTQELNNG